MDYEPDDAELLRIIEEEQRGLAPDDQDGGGHDPDVAHSGRYSG